ncbi:MAG: colicin V production CvpA [Confluentimicrobium sp.]|jgi:membrane protein required for colicin V production|uniref:Membrane protein required for colicin V production n=1 Tax=Actibacterium naphthalenivorans TaxID=1614693 RepID=A0A840C4I0_9RHOB|nr:MULTISPECIES: CvpA family protein [Actibacterium]KGB81607.1 colicin V production CvpA [Rhodovulum sp. NI22]MDY6860343.1 CvpA family protein [Pseudomonadota bacterium]ALG89914.1 colicin V production CvpA [Actibacterium sp. EMB200-NS6]MBB4020355.1 membrane protein required for colicin V production [Actibacterium naphthalenivorans]MBC55914.1 colicin V production CvpA [Actibacterium sp.]|tara:strand:- start:1194 stop:1754 length:561 start_codon:yes stop_codon:yes gene_type:complete
MEGFTIIDAVVAVVVVLSAILAYSRGLMREAMAILGWVAAAFLAFVFAPAVEPLIKQVPVLGEFIADSCEISIIAAFAAVFAVALVVVSIFAPLFSSVVQRSALGGVDQGLGFLFGVLRGIVLVAVAFFAYNTVVTSEPLPMVDDSRSASVFAKLTDKIEERDPEDALGWLTNRYDALVGTCGLPE